MKNLLIISVAAPKKEKERIDKKAQREFVTVGFALARQRKDGSYYADPFTSASRNIWQRHSADGKSASWGRTNPDILNELMENSDPIEGEIVTAKVKQFPVLGPDGKQNKDSDGNLVFADRYTTAVLGNEDTARVFAAANHEIVKVSKAATLETESELAA